MKSPVQEGQRRAAPCLARSLTDGRGELGDKPRAPAGTGPENPSRWRRRGGGVGGEEVEDERSDWV